MIDPEAVAVAIIGANALATADVDLAGELPCVIVETATSVPTLAGPHGEALVATLSCSSLAESRAAARDLAWEALDKLADSAGTVTDYGSVAHAAAESMPTPRPAESLIPDLHQFDFAVQLTLRTTRKDQTWL